MDGEHGFCRAGQKGLVVEDIVASVGKRELLYVTPETSISEAIEIMRNRGLKQVPVAKGDMPIAAAEIMGSLSEDLLMTLTEDSPEILNESAELHMEDKLPIVGIRESLDEVLPRIDKASVSVILESGLPSGVLTESDVQSFMSVRQTSEDASK